MSDSTSDTARIPSIPVMLAAMAVTFFVPGLGHLIIDRVNAGIQHFLCTAAPIALGGWLLSTKPEGSGGQTLGIVLLLIGTVYWLIVLGSLWVYMKHLDAQRENATTEDKVKF